MRQPGATPAIFDRTSWDVLTGRREEAAIHGDLNLRDITRAQVRQYRDMLAEFPRNTPHALQTSTPSEIIAWAVAHPNAKRLSRRTVNAKGLDSLSKLFNKAVDEGYVDANLCSHLKLKIKPEDRVKRLPLNEEDLRKLLSGPVHTDPNFRSIGGSGRRASSSRADRSPAGRLCFAADTSKFLQR